jgi:hypothetical protein
MLLVDESTADVAVTVSNPRNQALTVHATLTFPAVPDGQLVFDLPGDGYAGSSVTLTYNPVSSAAHRRAAVRAEHVNLARTPGGLVLRMAVGTAGPVRASLLQPNGRRVVRLVDRSMPEGRHDLGVARPAIPAGVYILRVWMSQGSLSRVVVL